MALLLIILFQLWISSLPRSVGFSADYVLNPVTGDKSVLVIPVEFNDVKHNTSLAEISSKLGKVSHYIQESSYNQTQLNFTIANRWYDANGTFSAFSYSVDLAYTPTLILVILRALSTSYNFSNFSYVMIVHAGYSFEKMRSMAIPSPFQYGGENTAAAVVIVSESDTVLDFMHESLHALGGRLGPYVGSPLRVPDLYDETMAISGQYDLQFMGNWDIMSSENVGPSAWTKLKLGWIPANDSRILNTWNNTIVTISALEYGSGTLVAEIPISESNATLLNGSEIMEPIYYLVEYRIPVGIDSNLTSSGVLITIASDVNYQEGLPGPVSEVANPVEVLQGSNNYYFQDKSLNLAIIVLNETSLNATILFTTPSVLTMFLNASSNLTTAASYYKAIYGMQSIWFGTIAPINSTRNELIESSSFLAEGKPNNSLSESILVISQIGSYRNQTIQWNLYLMLMADSLLICVVLAALLFFARRKPQEESNVTKIFVFTKFELIRFLVVGFVGIFGTTFFQLSGFSEFSYGISAGSNIFIEQGGSSMILGFVALVFGLASVLYLGRTTLVRIKQEE